MKYYIGNSVLDHQIVLIRQKIRLSMNGIVSDLMTQSGVKYKKNYGVSIPRIKEIAKEFTPNHDLALRLWYLGERETMILATLLEPVDACTPAQAHAWTEELKQVEMAQQLCMNLLCKLNFAHTLCLQFIKAENTLTRITGFLLGARIVPLLNSDAIAESVQQAVTTSQTDEYQLYKAISLFLGRLCRKDKETATFILKQIQGFEQSEYTSRRHIWNEVQQEMIFLNLI